jgi:hypothetical protein
MRLMPGPHVFLLYILVHQLPTFASFCNECWRRVGGVRPGSGVIDCVFAERFVGSDSPGPWPVGSARWQTQH